MEFGVKWLIFLSDERKRPHKNESTKSPSLSCDRGLFSLFMRKSITSDIFLLCFLMSVPFFLFLCMNDSNMNLF
ncbi:unnamed protein product [Rotaria socialis]